jgi:hypothetical protein
LYGERTYYRNAGIASLDCALSTKKFTSLDDLLNVMDGEKEGSTGDEKYEERFAYYLGLLASENPGDRWRSIEVLARTGDERVIDPLIEARVPRRPPGPDPAAKGARGPAGRRG